MVKEYDVTCGKVSPRGNVSCEVLRVKFLSLLGGNMGRRRLILRGPNEGMVSGIKRFDPMYKLLWCSIPVRPSLQHSHQLSVVTQRSSPPAV